MRWWGWLLLGVGIGATPFAVYAWRLREAVRDGIRGAFGW